MAKVIKISTEYLKRVYKSGKLPKGFPCQFYLTEQTKKNNFQLIKQTEEQENFNCSNKGTIEKLSEGENIRKMEKANLQDGDYLLSAKTNNFSYKLQGTIKNDSFTKIALLEICLLEDK